MSDSKVPEPNATAEEIDAILSALPEGATLKLQPGRYQSTFRLRRSITVVPAEGEGSVWIDAETGPAIAVTGGECVVQGLRLTSKARSSDVEARFQPGAVEVTGGQLSITECLIQGWTNGVVVSGNDSHVQTERSRIESIGRFGVHIHSGAHATVSATQIIDTRASGVVIEGETVEARLVNCTIEGTAGHGIEVLNSSPLIEGCSLIRSQMSGLAISGEVSAPRILRNDLRDISGNGIQVVGGAGGDYRNNLIRAVTGFGMVVGQPGSHPRLQGNKISGASVGMAFVDGSRGLAMDNQISGCKTAILVSGMGTLPELTNNSKNGPTVVDATAIEYARLIEDA
ncbi:MAG: right-handed parallel beta-helix repeat-containing protein [Dehalococcoidia bacterium]